MRIVFFGTPDLATPSLRALAERHDVAGVVCQPDQPVGRSKQPVAPPSKQWAEEHHIEVKQPLKLRESGFIDWLRGQNPDVCALVAYGRILPQSVLDVPTHGFLNVHPSLLPKFRGPSPIQSAIVSGEAESGVTIMRLDAGTDTGDMLSQEKVPIHLEDTTESLAGRLAELGARMLLDGLAALESGAAVFVPQDDSEASHTKKYEKSDGQIRWNMRAVSIHNQVRAAIPWPVAHCRFRGEIVRIHETYPLDDPAEGESGGIMRIGEEGLVVATGEQAISIKKLQLPGKKVLAVSEFLRGNPIEAGERFEDL